MKGYQLNSWRTKMTKMEPVVPISPAIGYLGGKRLLAKRLCARIDQIPHALITDPVFWDFFTKSIAISASWSVLFHTGFIARID